MILQPSPVCSSKFSFKNNTFSAEVSDFTRRFAVGRVYDDACDVGFTVISEKTGKGAVFALNKTVTFEEDVCYWEFVCVTPGLKQLKAVIYND